MKEILIAVANILSIVGGLMFFYGGFKLRRAIKKDDMAKAKKALTPIFIGLGSVLVATLIWAFFVLL